MGIGVILKDIKYSIDALRRNRNEIIWSRVLYYGVFIQSGLIYGLWLLFTEAMWPTRLIFYPFGMVCGLGITAGAHRLWSHGSYKANLPLRIILMVLNSCCKQHRIYEWVRDHRIHHKYSDTNADPHNARRGFFFAHLGWLLVKKNKEVLDKFESLDLSDLEADSVVMFQKDFYVIWTLFWCYVFPPLIPWYFWNEDPWISFIIMGVLRQSVILHLALLGNSAAHKFGTRPYDKNIEPVDNLAFCIAVIGEGWHNFHHVFPWDYRSTELGLHNYNLTTGFINFMARIGWAYDLKFASIDLVKKRKERTGDHTYMKSGEGIEKEDADVVKRFNNLREL